MSDLTYFPESGEDAWTYDIPSAEPCHLFMTDKNHTPDQVWFLTHDGNTSRDLTNFANILTIDLQQEMPKKVEEKLNMLAGVAGESFRMGFPPMGEKLLMKGQVSAIAKLLLYRGGFSMTDTPILQQLPSGDIWSVDVLDPYTQNVFSIKISEPKIDGRKRPFSIGLSGDRPEILDGLCALLSADMASADLSRIAIKIKQLLSPNRSSDSTKPYMLDCQSSYIAYVLLERYITHFYMDHKVNVLPHTNVVAINSNSTSNERGYSNVFEMC